MISADEHRRFELPTYPGVPTREWHVWPPEIVRLTGYFSLAVWLSVSFVHFT